MTAWQIISFGDGQAIAEHQIIIVFFTILLEL